MASNKAYDSGQPLQLPMPAAVKSGDLVIFGKGEAASEGVHDLLVGVANADATDVFSNVQAFTSFDTCGAFYLPVLGEAGCPLAGHPLKRGDRVYGDLSTATYDSTTNCWTGATIDGNSGGVFVGWLLDDVSAFACPAVSANVRVVLKGAN